MKKGILWAAALFAAMVSACASKPVSTATGAGAGGIHSDADQDYRATAVMEFIKRTNLSIPHNSDLALAAAGEVANILNGIHVNIVFPSTVRGEFTTQGNVDMVAEGIRVSKKEGKDLILFLDVRVQKRGRAEEDNRRVSISIDAWAVDAKKKKLAFKLSREGNRVMEPGARLSDVEMAVRATVVETARAIGEETGKLLNDYL